jgi:DNA-binding LacI/PurR family transcriptional regulator
LCQQTFYNGGAVTITLRDVAKLAGVSRPTANLILLGKGARFSPATRDKVIDAAKQLKYRPNLAARGLSRNRSFLIGVVIGEQHSERMLALNQRLQAEILAREYLPVTMMADGAEAFTSILQRMQDARVDAFLIAPEMPTSPQVVASLRQIREMGTPVVQMLSLADETLPCVALDYEACGYAAAKAMIDLGLRRIALWTGLIPSGVQSPTHDAEEAGFTRAVREAGLSPIIERSALLWPVPTVGLTASSPIHGEASRLLAKHAPLDGVVCTASRAAAALSMASQARPDTPKHFTLSHRYAPAIQEAAPERRVILHKREVELATQAVELILDQLDGPASKATTNGHASMGEQGDEAPGLAKHAAPGVHIRIAPTIQVIEPGK